MEGAADEGAIEEDAADEGAIEEDAMVGVTVSLATFPVDATEGAALEGCADDGSSDDWASAAED